MQLCCEAHMRVRKTALGGASTSAPLHLRRSSNGPSITGHVKLRMESFRPTRHAPNEANVCPHTVTMSNVMNMIIVHMLCCINEDNKGKRVKGRRLSGRQKDHKPANARM